VERAVSEGSSAASRARIGVVALVTVLGCVALRAERHADETRRPAAVHAVRAERLREVMAELDRAVGERLPQELDAGAARALRAGEAESAADALAAAAAAIPSALEGVRIADDDARRFRELAGRLHADALALREHLRRGERDAARQSLERMRATCETCHTAFRVLPAPRFGG
jgi:cytochrome c556